MLYDASCPLCRRARDWLAGESTYMPLELLAADSPTAVARYGELPWTGTELVVVADDGRTWIGPAAFVVAMWCTRRYRSWSFVLSGPTFAPLAERFFRIVSAKRGRLGALLKDPECAWCDMPADRS